MATRYVIRDKQSETIMGVFDTEDKAKAAFKVYGKNAFEVAKLDVAVPKDSHFEKEQERQNKIDAQTATRSAGFDHELTRKARSYGINPDNFEDEGVLREAVKGYEHDQEAAEAQAESAAESEEQNV